MFDEVVPTLPESAAGVKHLFERGEVQGSAGGDVWGQVVADAHGTPLGRYASGLEKPTVAGTSTPSYRTGLRKVIALCGRAGVAVWPRPFPFSSTTARNFIAVPNPAPCGPRPRVHSLTSQITDSTG
jgi:hypothetical protein